MRITFTDKIGLMTLVEIKLFQKKNDDNIVSASGFEFYVTDDQAERLKDLARNNPNKFRKMIMKKVTNVNPPVVINVGANPKLENTGKLKSGETFNDKDADYQIDVEMIS